MATGLKADVAMAGSELISCCYRSLAAPGLTARDVLDIVKASQMRNAELGVTGALLYAGGRFLQWLEGPADVVTRIMGYIGHDRRHQDVEVLSHEVITERRFADWHMQLSCAEADTGFLGLAECHEVVTVARNLLPEDTNVLPIDRIAAVRRFLSDVCAAQTLAEENGEDARTVALFSVRGGQGQRAETATVARLADLLLHEPLSHLPDIETLLRTHAPQAADFARLYERCAERIRRDRAEDRVSALHVTLALSALQLVLRRIHHQPDPQRGHGAVTVTTLPGQPAILEAALAGEMLRATGWSTAVLHPASLADLVARLAVTRTATLVVAPGLLDATTGAEDETMRLIAAVRAATGLPAQRILVGGELARAGEAAVRAAGADAAFSHLSELGGAVARVACPENADCGSMRACRMPTMQCCDKRINPDFLLANVMPSVLSRMASRTDRRRTA